MPSLKVIYFELPGRAEPIRLALGVGGISFENKVVTHEEWGAMKPTVAPMQLPLMEIDGKTVSQSVALYRYACKLSKVDGTPLYPEDPMEALLVDELVDLVAEIGPPLGKTFGIEDKAEREKARAAMVAPGGDCEKWIAKVDADLAKSASGYCLFDRLTMADISLFLSVGMLQCGWLDGLSKDTFSHLPNITKHFAKIAAHPQVKAYYKDATGMHAFFKAE